jgi:hypothetical protein
MNFEMGKSSIEEILDLKLYLCRRALKALLCRMERITQ